VAVAEATPLAAPHLEAGLSARPVAEHDEGGAAFAEAGHEPGGHRVAGGEWRSHQHHGEHVGEGGGDRQPLVAMARLVDPSIE
jgi:hypothetical protein